MCKKKLIGRVTAALLSAAMLATCLPANGWIKAEAAETEQVQGEFQFGSAGTELRVGEYSIPVSLKNASDITKDSMAASCVKNGKLMINEDGTADITIGLQAVTVFNVTAWAEQWNIYVTNLSGEKQAAKYTTNEDGNVDSITFRLPSKTMDGVYTDMYVSAMSTTMQAYFAFDFANASMTNSENTENRKNQFGSAGTELHAGEYSIPVSLKNASDIKKDSMAASCVKDGKLIVNEDGTADITIGLQAVSVFGTTAWAEQWKIYIEKDAEDENKVTAKYTTDEEGNVDSITFHLSENSVDGVYTDMYVSAMNTTMSAYFALDFVNADKIDGGNVEGNAPEKKTGTAKVQQFGGYDVNVGVFVLEDKITEIEVEGTNFEGSYADVNKTKLQAAADGMKASYVGKSATDAKEIEGVDAVSGATYSSEAIRSALLNALELEATGEEISLPTQKLAEGTYQVDIAFYTDNVKHSLVENDKEKATITVDGQGNMVLTSAVINGTEKEPLYFYEFNGYYEGNNVNGTLKAAGQVKKEDIDFSDDVFGTDEKVVTEVSFPLEGNFAETYCANASIYVPAMKNLTGEVGGVTFNQGRFSSDCFAKIYWDSLKKMETPDDKSGFGSLGKELDAGSYTLPVGMKNASDITKDSMASSCLQGAVLTVNADGRATVTLDLTAVSVMGQTAWASDWKIFKEQNTASDTIDAEVTKTDGDGNVTQIAFILPDNRVDGVYISMNAMGGRVMQAYLALDFADAAKEKEGLADGIYAVEGSMYKLDLATKSMADSAFNHTMQMTVQDGKATLAMNFKGMTITGLQGYLGGMKYYDTGYQKDANGNPSGVLKDVSVQSVQKYSDGVVISDGFGKDYPDMVSFEVIPQALEDGIVPLQVFVPIMESITAGTGNQNVYLKLNLENLKETTAEDDLFKDADMAPENPNPGENKPSPTPGTGGNKPSPTPGAGENKPSPSPAGNTEQSKPGIKVGQTVKIKGHTYKVTAKGKVTFTKCKKNAKTVTIPASVKVKGVICKVTGIAKNAMKNNKKLTRVVLGKNVGKIGKNAFKGCKKLKAVKLPKGIAGKKKKALKKQIKKAGISSKVKIK